MFISSIWAIQLKKRRCAEKKFISIQRVGTLIDNRLYGIEM